MSVNGFRVEFLKSGSENPATASGKAELQQESISIEHGSAVQRFEYESNTVLVDGYVFGCTTKTLLSALVNRDDATLSDIDGGFAAVVIDPEGRLIGHCDRLGMQSIYWQTNGDTSVIWSRWQDISRGRADWSHDGLGELLHYRWMSGIDTAVSGICKLPIWHRLRVDRDRDIQVVTTEQGLTPANLALRLSLSENMDRTRVGIDDTLEELAGQHDDVAVYLSGGVDSSLLAARAARIFKNCVLVTGVFKDSANPELPAARAFAASLKLRHIQVPIDSTCLAEDLTKLVDRKGGQINFHTLAMLQLNRAVPDDFPVMLHGEAADTFFGLTRFSRAISLLRRKRVLNRFPRVVLGLLLKTLGGGRLKQLEQLSQMSPEKLAVHHHSIKYDDEARALIDSISDGFRFGESAYTDVAYDEQILQANRLTVRARGVFQRVALATEVANHMQEAYVAGQIAGKMIFMPFAKRRLLEIAISLPIDQYAGDVTKPILRELSCEHFDRNLIFSKKFGFYVPYVGWLQGPFRKLVTDVREETELFDGRRLEGLSVRDNYELYWTLVNLLVLRDTMNKR